ncbi:MAG: 16S rRNA (cytosine(1402)-N(4))-methyltransferase RsmH [Mycoplasmataceae bacterium]|nr:16S rRNA (cytosine(1402)-N(4))-methyltransferase RsmH [Mycoplasmataceae bacterium]
MHKSVLSDETIKSLNIKENGVYIDCTLGHGGHSLEILKKLNNTGHLYSIDQDAEAIKVAKEKLKNFKNITIIKGNFVDLDKYISQYEIKNIDGILFDIGVNSSQFDTAERGFSYRFDSRLDMRMNQENELDAYKVINEYSSDMLTEIFRKYGEVKNSKQLSNEIVKSRSEKPIKNTFELNKVIDSVNPAWSKKNPYKQVYQALRIEVNNELDVIEKAIQKALDNISVDGRVAVITFHSLEDKIVKGVFSRNKQEFIETPMELKYKFRTFKSVYPTKKEVEENLRSRSSKLRIIRKNY